MRILVQKFGGTSVADLECMKKVRGKVREALAEGRKLVVVLSARSGRTNALLEMAHQWSDEPDPAEMDVLLATGEQESVALFSMLLQDDGIRARSLLGFQLPVLTDGAFGSARIQSIDAAMLRREVAVAAALGSVECHIFTDVDGVYTTDPRLCEEARKIDRISYDEMLEMSSMGAKVLQIRSVEFAKKYKVPVRVRSTFSSDPGTLVTQEDDMMESVLVSGIAYDKDQARVTLCGIPDKPGISAAIFVPLAEKGVLVDMIVQKASREGITDMTFTVSRKDVKRAEAIVEEVRHAIGGECVETDLNVAKVSVIGVGMRNHSGVAARAFAALHQADININMISTSEIKISCLIDEREVEKAVQTLHREFNLRLSAVEEQQR